MSDFTQNQQTQQSQTLDKVKLDLARLMQEADSAILWQPYQLQSHVTYTQNLVAILNRQLRTLPQSEGKPLRELTALTARSIAVTLHNRFGRTQMSLDLINFLLKEFNDLLDIRKKLLDDITALKKQMVRPGSGVSTNSTINSSINSTIDTSSPKTETAGTSASSRKKKGGFLKFLAVMAALLLGAFIFLNVKGTSAYNAGDYEAAAQYLVFTPFSRDKLRSACKKLGDDCLQEMDYAEAISYYNMAGSALQPEADYCRALTCIGKAATTLNFEENLENAHNYLNKCADIWNAAAYRGILQDLRAGNYTDAGLAIRNLPASSNSHMKVDTWKKLLSECLDNVSVETLQEGLDILYARWLGNGKIYTSEEFEDVLDSRSSAITVLPETSGDIAVTESELRACGKKPDGKVLITKQFHEYEGSYTKAVSLDLMAYLPEGYLPSNLDEVQYIINIKYDYKKDPTGSYMGTTVALVETGIIEITDASTGETLYTSPVVNGSSPPYMLSYYGDPPKFKSGNRPYMASTFQETMQELAKLT